MDACAGKKPLFKARIGYKEKLAVLLLAYGLFAIYIGGWFYQTVGYYGLQDAVNYQKSYESFRYDSTHWLTIGFMDIFGIRWWPILLGCVMIPYAFVRLYARQGMGYESVYNLYLYSPMILFLLVQNVYSQMLFCFFYVMYKADRKDVYEALAMLSHPAFIPLFVIEHYFEKRYKRILLMLIIGLTVYMMTDSYREYNFLNQNAANETSMFNVLLYQNPINMMYIPFNWYYIVLQLLGLMAHNGRFIMFAVIVHYYRNPGKWGKRWGLFVNFLNFYNLSTII